MEDQQLEANFGLLTEQVRGLPELVGLIQTAVYERLTSPTPADGPMPGLLLGHVTTIEDQVARAQRALGRAEVREAIADLAVAQTIIGQLRKLLGDPRTFEAEPAPTVSGVTAALASAEMIAGQWPPATVVVKTPLHPDLHDAPPNVGQLAGAYFTAKDEDKNQILVDSGYTHEQIMRWLRALQKPPENPVPRGEWVDKDEKPDLVG